ncbi:MAG: hypothetical protein HYU62_09020 [Caulobacterales bacterium]|nr:hypothetical protein [Caulobacterales bacterium]
MQRRLRPWFRLLAFPAALGAAALAGAALACSCVRPDSAADQLQDAELMIVATAAEVRRLPAEDGVRLADTRFTVTRTIKGEVRRNWWIRHGRDSPMCGVEFRPGQEYVILAHRAEGRLWTGLCSRAWFPIEEYERAAAES